MARYDYDEDDAYVVIEKHESAGITPFLVGLAVGAGVALLFAPRSGRATRRDIKRRAMRAKQAAEEAVQGATDAVVDKFHEGVDTVRNAIDIKTQQAKRAVVAGRAAAADARTELEERIAASKAAYRSGES